MPNLSLSGSLSRASLVLAAVLGAGVVGHVVLPSPARAAQKKDDKKAPKAAPPKAAPPKEITDEDVRQAIEKGRRYLIGQAKPDGSFASGKMKGGHSALAFMTLAYMGEHPNRDHIANGLTYLMGIDPDGGFDKRQGYALPIRVMGLSYIYKKLLGDRRRLVAMQGGQDIIRLQSGQTTNGGWRYELQPNNNYDFSVTQWPILAMRDAQRAGIEFPDPTGHLAKSLALYLKGQNQDGGWAYQAGKNSKSYGSMTAAGLASLYIIADFLEPNSGCPCVRGQSQRQASEIERAQDAALEWLAKNFSATANPAKGGRTLYWLYCVERVGIAAGYKYFGTHNWYKEGAAELVKKQGANGSWSNLEDTCFALLFLYKGRAPILFNKLKFDGVWNAHRRDIANLTHYIERTKEQMFHWQIVELKAPLDELHDAPILYVTAESLPEFDDKQKKKLRAFTDTGGTILAEASCGNPNVRNWFTKFAAEVWPEWKLIKLPQEHGVWDALHPMRNRPEVLGLSDGVRTAVFYSPDDISCAWQMKAYARRQYLFDWGINLYTYATDGAPLRAKLAARGPEISDRFTGPVKAGPAKTVRISRVQHGGDWAAGANYRGFDRLAKHVRAKAGITLQVAEPTEAPFNSRGVAVADLKPGQIAYLAGSADVSLTAGEQAAMKQYLAGGGFLWAEAVTGSIACDKGVRKLAADMGLTLKMLPGTHPVLHGRMAGAEGYNLTSRVQFRRSLRAQRMGRPSAEFYGLYDGERIVGLYSPFDVVFSLTGYEAHDCRGYKAEDAMAVGTNLALYFSTLK